MAPLAAEAARSDGHCRGDGGGGRQAAVEGDASDATAGRGAEKEGAHAGHCVAGAEEGDAGEFEAGEKAEDDA